MSISTLLIIVFISIISIQLAYYITFLISFALKKSKHKSKKNIALSVIICAKNEAENLIENLPKILNQDYSNFEVVLVNDCSTDETLEVMTKFEIENENVKLVNVKSNEAFWGNKKYALTLGIKASNNDFLVFTDADCKPNSNQWLLNISSQFSNKKSIVLGYGAYSKIKLSLLNKLIRFETVMTAIQYFSYANMGAPYMGVGRNMAYRKELFFNNSGFSQHMNLKSGDDDLFVNSVANKNNTAICDLEESFTISNPKTSFKDWILQKRRHISTARHYKSIHKFLLGLFFISQFLFWVIAVIILFSSVSLKLIVGLIILRFMVQMITIGISCKKLNEMDLIIIAPLLELFLICTQLSIFSINLISTPKHWK